MKRLANLLNRSQFFLLFVLFAVLTYINMYFYWGASHRYLIFPVLLLIFCLCFAVPFLTKLPLPLQGFLLFLLALLFRLPPLSHTPETSAAGSDFILSAAELFNQGNFASLRLEKILEWTPEVQGLIVYQALLLRIFGESTLLLFLFNTVVGSLSVCLLYRILVPFHRQTALLACLLFALNPVAALHITSFNGQPPGLLCVLLGIIFFQIPLDWPKPLSYSLSGIFFGLAYLLWPETFPLTFALLLFYSLASLASKERETPLIKDLAQLLIVFAGFAVVPFFFSLFAYKVGLRDSLWAITDLRYLMAAGVEEPFTQYFKAEHQAIFELSESQRLEIYRETMGRIWESPKTFLQFVFYRQYQLWKPYSLPLENLYGTYTRFAPSVSLILFGLASYGVFFSRKTPPGQIPNLIGGILFVPLAVFSVISHQFQLFQLFLPFLCFFSAIGLLSVYCRLRYLFREKLLPGLKKRYS